MVFNYNETIFGFGLEFIVCRYGGLRDGRGGLRERNGAGRTRPKNRTMQKFVEDVLPIIENLRNRLNGGLRDWDEVEKTLNVLFEKYSHFLEYIGDFGVTAPLVERQLFSRYPEIKYYCTAGAHDRLQIKYNSEANRTNRCVWDDVQLDMPISH